MKCDDEWIDMYCCKGTVVLRWIDFDEELRSGKGSVGIRPALFPFWDAARELVPWWPAFVEARRRSQGL
jgi:hypothetical protein